RRVAWDNSVLRRFRAGRRILSLRTRDGAVRYARGDGIDIGTSDPRPVQLDGDEFGEATHVSVRLAPGALRIAIPRGHSIARAEADGARTKNKSKKKKRRAPALTP